MCKTLEMRVPKARRGGAQTIVQPQIMLRNPRVRQFCMATQHKTPLAKTIGHRRNRQEILACL